MNPAGTDRDINAPFLRRPDSKEIYGGYHLLSVQQRVVQVTDNQPDFLSQLPYKILFHSTAIPAVNRPSVQNRFA
jgi:hypothetical protein